MMKYLLLLTLVITIIAGCKEDEPTPCMCSDTYEEYSDSTNQLGLAQCLRRNLHHSGGPLFDDPLRIVPS